MTSKPEKNPDVPEKRSPELSPERKFFSKKIAADITAMTNDTTEELRALGKLKATPETNGGSSHAHTQLPALVQEAERRAYLQSIEEARVALFLERDNSRLSKTRTGVYGSETGSNHIVWVQETSPILSGVSKKGLSYRYLQSAEGSPEHSLLLEAEGLMMKAFLDAKKIFPQSTKIYPGFIVFKQGENTGMTTGTLLGIGVNSDNTDELFALLEKARKTGDYSAVHAHMAWIQSAFAHEMTHNARGAMDDHPSLNANEVPSHAIQFLSIWDQDQSFFARRIQEIKTDKPKGFQRIHAEVGGLHVVQQKLITESRCRIKPKDFSPEELQKAIRSIPDSIRAHVLMTLAESILKMPVTAFEYNVRTVQSTLV